MEQDKGIVNGIYMLISYPIIVLVMILMYPLVVFQALIDPYSP